MRICRIRRISRTLELKELGGYIPGSRSACHPYILICFFYLFQDPCHPVACSPLKMQGRFLWGIQGSHLFLNPFEMICLQMKNENMGFDVYTSANPCISMHGVRWNRAMRNRVLRQRNILLGQFCSSSDFESLLM